MTEKGRVPTLTVLRHLPRAPLQQQTDTPAPGLDQLDGPGVGHVPRALPVDLDDLVPDLDATEGEAAMNRCGLFPEEKSALQLHHKTFMKNFHLTFCL